VTTQEPDPQAPGPGAPAQAPPSGELPFGEALKEAVVGLRAHPPLLFGLAIAMVLATLAIAGPADLRLLTGALLLVLVLALGAWILVAARRRQRDSLDVSLHTRARAKAEGVNIANEVGSQPRQNSRIRVRLGRRSTTKNVNIANRRSR
jgi:hypothetical protein